MFSVGECFKPVIVAMLAMYISYPGPWFEGRGNHTPRVWPSFLISDPAGCLWENRGVTTWYQSGVNDSTGKPLGWSIGYRNSLETLETLGLSEDDN